MSGIVEIFPRNPSELTDASVAATAVAAKTTSGWLVGGNAFNPHATDVAYLQIFGVAAADVTLGTTVPVFTVAIPAGVSVVFDPPRPVQCITAISYAVTATRLGAGAPTAACSLFLQYA